MFEPYFPSDSAPATARSRPRTPSSDVDELKREVERLLLISEGLWRILKQKHALEDNELARQIALIDLEDGKLDGRKPASPPAPCPKCGRVVASNRPRCLFCAESLTPTPFSR